MEISRISRLIAEKFLPREFDALIKVKHKNVLEVYDIFRSNNSYYVFMQFAPNGCLMDKVSKGKTISRC